MLKEFKEFIMSGNVVDFAVAVILAGAVGLMVNSFVSDVVMPVVGYFAGGMDFSDLRYVLEPASVAADGTEVKEVAVRWGAWLNTIMNLIIVGFVMFMIVKSYNKATKRNTEEEPAGPTSEELLAEIRDALKK